MWAEAVKTEFSADKAFCERLEAMLALQVRTLLEYFDKVMPQLQSRRAVLTYRPERLLYAETRLRGQLGRLATLLLLLQRVPEQDELRSQICRQLLHLVNEHTGCRLPVYDGQAIDLTLVLAALMASATDPTRSASCPTSPTACTRRFELTGIYLLTRISLRTL